jgi:hypothetical protein
MRHLISNTITIASLRFVERIRIMRHCLLMFMGNLMAMRHWHLWHTGCWRDIKPCRVPVGVVGPCGLVSTS